MRIAQVVPFQSLSRSAPPAAWIALALLLGTCAAEERPDAGGAATPTMVWNWLVQTPAAGVSTLELAQLKSPGCDLRTLRADQLRARAGDIELDCAVMTSGGKLRDGSESLDPRKDRLLLWLPPPTGHAAWALPAARLLVVTAGGDAGDGRGAAAGLPPLQLEAKPGKLVEPSWTRSEVTRERTFLEKLPPIHASDDPWFWVRLMSAQSAEEAEIVLRAPGADARAAQVSVQFFVPGMVPGLAVEVLIGGKVCAVVDCSAEGAREGTAAVPAGAVANGELRLKLRLVAPPGHSGLAQVFVASGSVEYESKLLARDGRLEVPLRVLQAEVTGEGSMAAAGFASRRVLGVLLQADGKARWLELAEASKGRRREDGYVVRISRVSDTASGEGDSEAGNQTIVLLDESRVGSAAVLGAALAPRGEELPAGTPLVVVADPSLGKTLAPWVALRRRQGWGVLVVDPRQLYAAHGDGSASPESLAAGLAELLAGRAGTTPVAAHAPHVVLVGTASYDVNRYLAAEPGKEGTLLPVFYVDTERMVTGSDTRYGDLDGDGAPEIVVGRIPVRGAADLALYLAKLLPWETRAQPPALRRALFATDAPDAEGRLDFAQVARQLAALVPVGVERLEVGQGTPAEQSQFLPGIAAAFGGSLDWVTYVGHGSITAWSKGSTLAVDNVATVTTSGGTSPPPVVVALNCLNAYFLHPSLVSLAEAFLLSPQGGARAYLGSTTFSGSRGTFQAALFLHEELGQAAPGTTLGEFVLAVRRRIAAEPGLAEVQRTWVLLGDPSQSIPTAPGAKSR